jgi:polyvinyl alcohol dehydrogenase (cytochrome)
MSRCRHGLLRIVVGWMVVAGASLACGAPAALAQASWTVAGQSANDNRFQPAETTIGAGNVGQLAPKWVFTTSGDISATPTVSNGVVYFPDWGGNLYAVNEQTGQELWQMPISSYDGVSGAISRVSPAIYYDPAISGNELILGDNLKGAHSTGATMFGVNASTGALLWKTQVDSSEAAIITGSPTLVGSTAVVGVSSDEQGLAQSDTYACCTFRGSVVALNAITGQILWKTYTVPANAGPCRSADPMLGCGYSGGAVWSSPAYDAQNNTIYVGTGDNYTTPTLPRLCEKITVLLKRSNKNCTRSNDYFDAMLALDASTGKVDWDTKVEGWDAFTIACASNYPGVTWCPSPESPDYDFGSGANLITTTGANGEPETLIGAGQKSGEYWAFNPTTGAVVWSSLVGPGSSLGGIMWGTAFDGQSIYAPESDFFGATWTLVGGQAISNGAWSALNPQTGALEWQTDVPAGARAYGPVSAANGVVYAGSSAPTGPNFFALSAATGAILWSYASGGSAASSPAIVDGNVFWGSGYSELSSNGFTGNDLLYDFALPSSN